MRKIFGNVAKKHDDASLSAFIDKIILARPDLAEATFYAPSQGKNSLTVMTVDEVFKAPNRPEDAAHFLKEYKFLEHMSGCDLGLAVPAVTHPAGEKDVFYGMSRLHGEPLTRALLESLPQQEQEKIADDLARFNARFSTALTEGDRQSLGLDHVQVVRPLSPQDVTAALDAAHMRETLGTDYESATRVAAQYAQSFNEEVEKSRTIMIHSDLHPGNILYDRENKKLAVIDLGAGRTIAVDMGFSPLNHSYPPAWMERYLDAFGKESGIDVTRAQIEGKKCLYGIDYLARNPNDEKGAAFFRGEIQQWTKTAAEKPAAPKTAANQKHDL
ncbi:MAG: aminoglycoside phosphotransferase family protein [Alphaproteobacteria bacterium]|jgi:serine/threonine protein kinase